VPRFLTPHYLAERVEHARQLWQNQRSTAIEIAISSIRMSIEASNKSPI
jgi:hypothetical protein